MRFNFHGTYLDKDIKIFQLTQEKDLVKICRYLSTNSILLNHVRFEIFDTKDGKQEADPNHSISRASARFNEMRIYRYWLPNEDPHYSHEITHLVAHTWTKPYLLNVELDTAYNTKIKKTIEMVSTSFMQEGLAIAVDDIVFKLKLMEDGKLELIDDWCKGQLDKLPIALKKVINFDGFCSLENKIVVPFAASLSKYLLQKFGIDRYKEMYIQLKETVSPEVNVKIIESVYKLNEDKILSQWRKSI